MADLCDGGNLVSLLSTGWACVMPFLFPISECISAMIVWWSLLLLRSI